MPPMKGPHTLKSTCRLWHGLPWVTYLFTWLAAPQSLKHIITSGRQSIIAKTARKDFVYTLHACGLFNSFRAKSDREMMVGLDFRLRHLMRFCDSLRINWWNFLELRLILKKSGMSDTIFDHWISLEELCFAQPIAGVPPQHSSPSGQNYPQQTICCTRVTYCNLFPQIFFTFSSVCNQTRFFFHKLQDITCPLISTNCGRWLRPVCLLACSWSGCEKWGRGWFCLKTLSQTLVHSGNAHNLASRSTFGGWIDAKRQGGRITGRLWHSTSPS